jgi:hypothetical protein
MNRTTTLMLVAATVALGACNAPDANRTTKAPPGVNNPTAVVEPLTSRSAPPASPERGPVAQSGNTVAPGTNASVAFAQQQSAPTASTGAPPSATAAAATAVNAQEAAAKAADTASADAAKAQVKAEATGGEKRVAGTAQDTSANSPRHGDLTAAEESTQMPKAGQANNHSSTALEGDSGRPRQP